MNQLKIFWAFDPYAEMKETWIKTARLLKKLKKETNAEVQPVYFFGHELMAGLPDASTFSQIDALKPILEKVMASHLKELGIADFQPPRVVPTAGYSQRQDIDSMSHYLNEKGCGLLVLNTHARKGLKRLYLGSFAENALLKVEVPTLFISPHTEKAENFEKVFYPTDFSDQSFRFFKRFLEEPVFPGKKIVFYSKVISPMNTVVEAASHGLGGGWVSIEHLLKDIAGQRTKDSEKWLLEAKKHGLEARAVIDEKPGVLVEDLLKAAEESKADLIVMPSFVSKLETVLVGSLAREVVRNTTLPVLVKHHRER